MKLDKFLVEGTSGRTKNITQDDAVKIIRSSCMKNFKTFASKGTGLWRGVRTAGFPYGFVDPKKSTRQSANTENYYTLWMDNHPSWKQLPNRSQSIICSSNIAGAYGHSNKNKYLVIPKDGSRIGIAPNQDIWDSFSDSGFGEDLSSLNELLWRASRTMGIIKGNVPTRFDQDWKTMIHHLRMMDVEWQKMRDIKGMDWSQKDVSGYPNELMIWMREHRVDSFVTALETILDPKSNKFKVVTSTDKLPSKTSSPQECWTSGGSVLIQIANLESDNSEEWMEFTEKIFA